MVFQIQAQDNELIIRVEVSIPDGDVWFFKLTVSGALLVEGRVSIPDGDVWFFK